VNFTFRAQSVANYKARFGFGFLGEEAHKPLLEAAQVGLGRIVALHHRPSTPYQIP
jgi:hypothetical protein